MSFTNIIIEPSLATYNYRSQLTTRPCVIHNGKDGDFVVTRTSVLTGRIYSDYYCKECADNWRESNKRI